MADLYGLLGIEKRASADEIKRAYRKEALVKHPDRGGEKEAFQALQSAYDVLSDPDKRAHYDMTGSIPQDGGGGGGGPSMPDLASIFGSFFGGGVAGMPFFGGPGPGSGFGISQSRGPNKIHEIGVSLAELYKGKTFKLTMKRDVLCQSCDGKGGSRMETCGSCGGKGFRLRGQQMGPIMAMTQEPCATCSQTGSRVLEPCSACEGRRLTENESVLDVVIQPGMQEGDRLVFPGQCSESPMFREPGDVILVIRETGTPDWTRRGYDLISEVRLTVAESLLGWGRHMEGHPSGRPLHIVWKGGVLREGEVLRIQGWGMPGKPSGLGDLRLVVRIMENESQGAWSEEQQRALQSVWPSWTEPDVTADSVILDASASNNLGRP
jgi:DnaJ family protein A protein 2